MPYRSTLKIHDTGDLYNGTRQCRTCKEVQDINNFYWANNHTVKVRECKKCKKLATQKRTANKPKDALKSYAYHIRKTYGISIETFNQLFEEQNGCCLICEQKLNVGTKNSVAQVDHCHKTEAIRGILCFNCNTGIGKLQDNPLLLRKAAEYLEADKPLILTIDKYMSKEEISASRSKSALNQHRSQEGKASLKRRSWRFGGENSHAAKLSNQEVTEIRKLYAEGQITQAKLAEIYEVSQSNIHAIVTFKTRKTISEDNA